MAAQREYAAGFAGRRARRRSRPAVVPALHPGRLPAACGEAYRQLAAPGQRVMWTHDPGWATTGSGRVRRGRGGAVLDGDLQVQAVREDGRRYRVKARFAACGGGR